MIIDDLIATGGTANAAIDLVRKSGGEVVAAAFVIDLPDLGGAGLCATRASRLTRSCPSKGTLNSGATGARLSHQYADAIALRQWRGWHADPVRRQKRVSV